MKIMVIFKDVNTHIWMSAKNGIFLIFRFEEMYGKIFSSMWKQEEILKKTCEKNMVTQFLFGAKERLYTGSRMVG